jgi:hypothetical protein
MSDGGTGHYRVLEAVTVSRTALTVLLALASADVVLTVVGRQLCFTEQNPFARWILHTFGTAGLVGLKGVALAVLGVTLWYLPTRYERAAVAGFGLTQLFAVGWNSMLLLSQSAICGG